VKNMDLNVLEVELEIARKIFWLLKNDYIFLTEYNHGKEGWDDGAYPAINCNDIFVPGAHSQNLPAEDLDKYIDCVKKFPEYGQYAWCGFKLNANPWRWTEAQKKNPEYYKALQYLKDKYDN